MHIKKNKKISTQRNGLMHSSDHKYEKWEAIEGIIL